MFCQFFNPCDNLTFCRTDNLQNSSRVPLKLWNKPSIQHTNNMQPSAWSLATQNTWHYTHYGINQLCASSAMYIFMWKIAHDINNRWQDLCFILIYGSIDFMLWQWWKSVLIKTQEIDSSSIYNWIACSAFRADWLLLL